MTKSLHLALRAAALVLGLLGTGVVLAHGDEDHSTPAATAVSATLPRIGETTEDFELVAVLEGSRLLIYVDRSASNEPVAQARLEVDGSGSTAGAAEVEPGVYALNLAQPLAPGAHALTFTIQTAGQSDLVTGTLDVPVAADASPHESAAIPGTKTMAVWPWLAGGATLLTLIVIWRSVRRRHRVPAVREPRHHE